MTAGSRVGRLVRVLALILDSRPHGIRAGDLAHRLECSPRTVYRDLEALGISNFPVYSEGKRWHVDPEYRLPTLQLTLHEAVALYLASRLAGQHSDTGNPHLASALQKMSAIVPPTIGPSIGQIASAMALAAGPGSQPAANVLETLALAWANGQAVRIRYQGQSDPEPRDRVVDVLFLEPRERTRSTYLVARDRGLDETRTFKLERIQAVEPTGLAHQREGGLTPERYFARSWGVGFGEPTRVVLRFQPSAAKRVAESSWHASEERRELSDGRLELVVTVAGTLEIRPWILSWGDGVEVIEPKELRQSVAAIAQTMHQRYAAEPA